MSRPVIDRDNPWPWFDPFTESAAAFFNGRNDDSDALLRAVMAAPATVLFGKSGLGKTSLLQAGLFPRLRRLGLLPVIVRLKFGEGVAPAAAQIRQRLLEECAASSVTAPGDADCAAGLGAAEDRLWLDLHTVPARSGPQTLVQPVLVLDQFEEIFTLGGRNRTAQERDFGALGDLIENRIPAAVAQAIASDEDILDRISLDSQRYRVVVSLREDYLAELERWCDRIPRLGPNRCRLLPMQESQALDAVRLTGGSLVTEGDAATIVRFVSSQGAFESGSENLPEQAGARIEPALLSLLCSGLNAERQAAGATKLDTSNLEQRGGQIIESFYTNAIEAVAPSTAVLVEDELITPDGVRLLYPVRSAVQRSGASKEDVDTLINRRLLRREYFPDGERIELVHDRLAAVALRRRQGREIAAEQKRLRDEAERSEHERQRLLRLQSKLKSTVAALAVLLAIAVAAAWIAARESERARAAQGTAAAALHSAELARADATHRGEEAERQRGLATTAQALAEARASEAVQAQTLAESRRVQAQQAQAAAEEHAKTATAEKLAGDAAQSLQTDLRRSLLLSVAAMHVRPTANARRALQQSLSAEPRLDRISSFGVDGGRLRAVSPAGKLAAFVRDSAEIVVLDVETSTPVVAALNSPPGTVAQALAFSPDDALLAWVASPDRTRSGGECAIVVWELARRLELARIAPAECRDVQRLEFGASGRTLAIATATAGNFSGVGVIIGIELWDIDKHVRLEPKLATLGPDARMGYVRSMAVSPSGNSLAVGDSQGHVAIWDLRSGALLRAPFAGHRSAESSNDVQALAFSPDGTFLMSGGSDQRLVFWDVQTGVPAGDIGHAVPITAVRWQRLPMSGASDGTVRIWGYERSQSTLGGKREVEFRPNLEALLGGIRGPVGQIHQEGYVSASNTHLSTLRAVGRNGAFVQWDVRKPRSLALAEQTVPDGPSSVSFSADGKRVAVAGNSRAAGPIAVFDTPSLLSAMAHVGRNSDSGTEPVELLPASKWRWLAYSPDGRRLLAQDDDGEFRIWNVDGREPKGVSLIAADKARRLDTILSGFAWNGRLIAAGDLGTDEDDGGSGLALWDGTTGKLLRRLHRPPRADVDPDLSPARLRSLASLALSPDGRWIVSTYSGSSDLWLWSTKVSAQDPKRLGPHFGGAASIRFHPSGKLVATAGYDNAVRFWQVPSGKADGEALRHGDAVTDVAFSRDGTVLATVTWSAKIQLWDTVRRIPITAPLGGLERGGAPHRIALSPDGNSLVAYPRFGGLIQVWRFDFDQWTARACRMAAGQGLSVREWREWMGSADIELNPCIGR